MSRSPRRLNGKRNQAATGVDISGVVLPAEPEKLQRIQAESRS